MGSGFRGIFKGGIKIMKGIILAGGSATRIKDLF